MSKPFTFLTPPAIANMKHHQYTHISQEDYQPNPVNQHIIHVIEGDKYENVTISGGNVGGRHNTNESVGGSQCVRCLSLRMLTYLIITSNSEQPLHVDREAETAPSAGSGNTDVSLGDSLALWWLLLCKGPLGRLHSTCNGHRPTL